MKQRLIKFCNDVIENKGVLKFLYCKDFTCNVCPVCVDGTCYDNTNKENIELCEKYLKEESKND